MKKTLFIISLICCSLTGMTQEVEKQKEVAVTFRSLNSFGLTYKSGDVNSKWRFNVVDCSIDNNIIDRDTLIYKNSDFSCGFSVGRERIKKINDKFEIKYGVDLGINYKFHSNEAEITKLQHLDKTTQKDITPTFNLVLGTNYKISNSIIIGAEIKSYIGYQMTKISQKYDSQEIKYDRTAIIAGLSNGSILMSIGYRF